MRAFGLGGLFAVPTAGGTPIEFAKLQDVTTDFSFDVKELYGQYSFPIETARGKGKIALKAGFAEIRAETFNQIIGGTTATGSRAITRDNAYTIPVASGPYTVVITVPASGTFVGNLQVVDVTDTTNPPIPYTQITAVSVPTSTQTYYVGATSVTYVFTSADAGKSIQITYEYSVSTGKTITLVNPVMGVAPRFTLRAYNTYSGKQYGYYFPACISSKMSAGMKLEDFVIPDFDVSAFADGANNVAYWYIQE